LRSVLGFSRATDPPVDATKAWRAATGLPEWGEIAACFQVVTKSKAAARLP
jgi:hypothetical protein